MLHESRVAKSNSQPLTLSDSVIDYAFVRTQNIAVNVDEIAFFNRRSVCVRGNIIRVIPISDKADILRIALVGDVNSCLCSYGTHSVFIKISERHQSAREVLLRELVEHVALVLFSVLSSLNRVSAVLVDDVCVMPCRNVFCLVDVGPVDHAFPLNVEVAADAGIGRFAVQVA